MDPSRLKYQDFRSLDQPIPEGGGSNSVPNYSHSNNRPNQYSSLLQQQQQQQQQQQYLQQQKRQNMQQMNGYLQEEAEEGLVEDRMQQKQVGGHARVQGEVHEIDEEDEEGHGEEEEEEEADLDENDQLRQPFEATVSTEQHVDVDEEEDEEEQDGQEQDEEEEEEEEEHEEEEQQSGEDEYDNQELVCMKCENQVQQALALVCGHKLCLSCASTQYKMMFRKMPQKSNQSHDLIQSIDCELCGVATPLVQDSIRVLLSLGSDQQSSVDTMPIQQEANGGWQLNESFNVHNDQDSQQQQHLEHDKQHSSYLASQQFHQQQQQQQQQKQQQPLQKNNMQSQQFYSNSTQPQNEQQSSSATKYLQQGQQQQHQSHPSFSQHLHNINGNNGAVSALPAQPNYIQDNEFHQNILANKEKRQSEKRHQKQSSASSSSSPTDSPILYCFSCESACFSLEEYLNGLHKNHNVKNVSKAYSELQEPIEELRLKMKTKSDLLAQDEGRLQKKRQEMMNALEGCKSSLNSSFQEVINALQQKQQELVSQAEEIMCEKLEELEKGVQKVHQSSMILEEFDKGLEDIYYKSERVVENEIRAFNYFSENKAKILSTVQQLDSNVFESIRDKLAYEYRLDTNSLQSHVQSIRKVEIEITRLHGLEPTSHTSSVQQQTSLKEQFYSKPNEDKSKRLLEQIIKQHATTSVSPNSTVPAYRFTSHFEQEKDFQSSSEQNNLMSANSLFSAVNLANQNASYPLKSEQHGQISPNRYINIQMNSCIDSSRRYQSPIQTNYIETTSNTFRKLRTSPERSSHFSNSSSNFPVYKAFSISSQSAKQEFLNILQSPSNIAKKYTPNFDRPSLQPRELKQSSPAFLKPKTLDNFESFKRNMDEIRRQQDENNLNSFNNYLSPNNYHHHHHHHLQQHQNQHPTPDQQAAIAAQNRIKHLQDKFSTKLC